MTEDQKYYTIEKAKRDNAILRKYAAIQKASEDKIGCQKIYVDMTDDLKAALVLDEIIFFTLPRVSTGKSGLRVWKDGYLWMAVRRTEWWDRKRLSERESDLAIDKLENLGLIIKKVHRFNSLPTVHLRLNVDKFFQLYFDILERDNPPEVENNNDLSDINDLYEMMGIPFSPNRNLPNGEGKSPNGDDSLPNGDSINSPDQPSPNPFSEKDIKDANRKVDAILDFQRQSEEAKKQGKGWKQRNQFSFNEHVQALADLCVLRFGEPSKRDLTTWAMEIGSWVDAGARVGDWERAEAIVSGYSQPVVSITGMTKAVKFAAQERKNGQTPRPTEERHPEWVPFVPPDESQFVPAPPRIRKTS